MAKVMVKVDDKFELREVKDFDFGYEGLVVHRDALNEYFWSITDLATGRSVGTSEQTKKKTIEKFISDNIWERVVEYRKTEKYSVKVREFEELKGE